MTKSSKKRMPRLKDVADVAGVSYQTVSRVINSHPNVSKATQDRVQSAVRELGYRRNSAARSLVTQRSQTIGVLASEVSQFSSGCTLLGVEQATRDAGYFVSIASLQEVTKTQIINAVDHLTDQAVDGIVALAPHADTFRALTETKLPAPVVFAGAPGSSNVGGARVDQRQGARLAVRHLIGLGHRTIAHVCGPPEWNDSSERAAGWRETLRKSGLNEEFLLQGDGSAGSGYNIGRQLAEQRTVTAVFVGSDQMALGVLRAFAEANIRVPQDISVIGFDDQPESGYFNPPLTTVRQDFEDLGRQCVGVLLSGIHAGAGAGCVVITPHLVLRSSTGPPP